MTRVKKLVKRIRTNVRIDEDVKNEAHRLGINVSRFLEEKLKEYIEREKVFRQFLEYEKAKEKGIKP